MGGMGLNVNVSMGNMINNAGSINKMIHDGIQLRNKAYYVNSRLLGIRLISHMAKMKIYVTYQTGYCF